MVLPALGRELAGPRALHPSPGGQRAPEALGGRAMGDAAHAREASMLTAIANTESTGNAFK